MSNVITKFYKIINPESAKIAVDDYHDLSGTYGVYSNYSWFNRLIQGSSSRQQRYHEYESMNRDTDMGRAINIYAQEITGNNPKSEQCLKIAITSGDEESISSTTLTTLNAALKAWIKIHEWDLYLMPVITKTCIYGDAFFKRGKKNTNKWQWIHPKNVLGAVVPHDDITKVKAWQLRTDTEDATQQFNSSLGLIDNQNTYNMEMVKADDMVHFSLHDNLADEAPFSKSIFTNIYTTFKQKQMLEDSVLIYRIVRAPEKRVFKVEVGNMPAQARAAYLTNFMKEIKQRKSPTPYGGQGQIESIYSPISQNEDIFLTQKDGKGTTIETLPAGQSLGELSEVQYFYQKIWRGLGIPQSYIDNTTEGGAVISDGKVGIAYQQELQFILRIEQLQLHFEKTLDYEFKRFLHESNINTDETVFKVVLPDPSNYKQSRKNAIAQETLNLASNALSIPWIAAETVALEYLGWTRAQFIENERRMAIQMGLDPNDRSTKAKIYNPENADAGGYEGGLTDGTGMSGFKDNDMIGGADVDLDQEPTDTESPEIETIKPAEPTTKNNNKNPQK